MRDQANKTLDLFLQRVRQHGSTMADSVLPPPSDVSAANNTNAARIGTSNDTSWAGWAISSFTNKLTAANGEIQPTSTPNALAAAELARPSSVPQPAHAPVAETLHHTPSHLKAAHPLVRASSETAAQVTTTTMDDVDEDYDDAWGADAWDQDDDQAEDKADEDTFFDTAPSPAPAPAPAAVPYDDGGEPDFAGWLAAQSKAKAKKPLLSSKKSSSASKDLPVRSAGTSKTPATTRASKPAKVIDTKPKEAEGEEDGWGDAW